MSSPLSACLIAPLLGLAALASAANPQAVAAQQRAAPVAQGEQLTPAHKARQEAEARKAEAEHKAQAEAFRKQEDTRIQKENAKLQARLALTKQGRKPDAASRDQIGAEARQLKDRATKAQTDAERAQVHKRAQELLEQLGR